MQQIENISASQVKAIAALCGGQTVRQSAKLARVDRSTLARWMAEDRDFIAAFNEAKREEVEAIRSQVQRLQPLAINKVHSILKAPLNSKHVSTNTQLRAALTVLIGPDALADIDRKLMAENVTVESSGASAADMLSSRIAQLASRTGAQEITIDVNGVASE